MGTRINITGNLTQRNKKVKGSLGGANLPKCLDT